MAKQKIERNKLFLEDWQKGFSNEDLGKKYKMTEGGVKALKQRLRVRNPNLYTEKHPGLTKVEREVAQASAGLIKFADKQTSKPAIQQTSKQEKKRPAKEVYDTATYYIDKETKKKIKILAAEQDREISEIVRQILSEYFNKH